MLILRGFLTLFGFYLLGESSRLLFGLPISGGVLGMMLLALWLMVRGTVSEPLGNASQALISVLVLLIMPGVVGVFFTAGEYSGQWLAIGAALVLGTLLSVITTLLLMRAVVAKGQKHTAKPDDRHV